MRSLNEKLAELVMGWSSYYSLYYESNVWDLGNGRQMLQSLWNPTTDLNQLRECYLAAEKDWDTDKHMESFGSRFARCLSELLAPSQDSVFAFDVALITAWVKHPELVAQAILKAKGVDV